MKMEIKKFTPDQLKEFIESPEFSAMPEIPVSYHRAVSWLNNPKIDPGDVIMYLAMENDEMIGYRCILPDRLGRAKFGWLSGNWVRPSRRREGIASRLFEEAMKDWDNKLMSANYSSASRAVYDKTGNFNLYKEICGVRAYLRMDLARLLPPRRKFFARIKILLKVLDCMLNIINDFRLMFIRRRFTLPVHGLKSVGEIDDQLAHFISARNVNWSSFRGQKELNWIIHFPWVIERQRKDEINRKYYFTATASQYCNLNLELFDEHDQLVLYMMLAIVDQKMTIPYSCFESIYVDKAVDIIMDLMLERKINYVTLFDPQLAIRIRNRKLPFLLKKKMIRRYFATKDLMDQIPPSEEVFIQDGDGDFVFT